MYYLLPDEASLETDKVQFLQVLMYPGLQLF